MFLTYSNDSDSIYHIDFGPFTHREIANVIFYENEIILKSFFNRWSLNFSEQRLHLRTLYISKKGDCLFYFFLPSSRIRSPDFASRILTLRGRVVFRVPIPKSGFCPRILTPVDECFSEFQSRCLHLPEYDSEARLILPFGNICPALRFDFKFFIIVVVSVRNGP